MCDPVWFEDSQPSDTGQTGTETTNPRALAFARRMLTLLAPLLLATATNEAIDTCDAAG